MNKTVRPKKSLGQHFLHDQNIARKIVDQLLADGRPVLEIGPGMGILTRHLLERNLDLTVIELDRDSVSYLREHFPELSGRIIEGDFLTLDLSTRYSGPFSIIGNFPYNISSQIFFRVLENRNQVKEVVCMLQKEVAQRIASSHGNKVYGILSVLIQAFYNVEYLFTVSPSVFRPPPKVMSAVIRLTRNENAQLECDEELFFKVVKQGFNNRRKTLRNALKPINLPPGIVASAILDNRAEQLSVNDFVHLTRLIGN